MTHIPATYNTCYASDPQADSNGLSFAQTLNKHRIELRRAATTTLQINTGLLCNQVCRHCHLEAGPGRHEVMSRATMDEVIAFAGRYSFQSIDITGGAPELAPDLRYFIEKLRPLTTRLLIRSNLTALAPRADELLSVYQQHKVAVIASLPSAQASQTDAQRGKGVFAASVAMLRKLNDTGYGMDGSGLELHLVANPAGAYLPASQCQTEKKFKRDMKRKWGIEFNRLYTFANAPLGRYRHWLEESGNLQPYLRKLAASFNPATVGNLMCRSLVSISWDGCLYDCDFNQAAGLPLDGVATHVSEAAGPPGEGAAIMTGEHCFACTAGAGFT